MTISELRDQRDQLRRKALHSGWRRIFESGAVPTDQYAQWCNADPKIVEEYRRVCNELEQHLRGTRYQGADVEYL